MARPRLTFACELDAERLSALFADGSVVGALQRLDARVALMLSDLSDERTGVVRHLNRAGIAVVGIPLLPLEDGYYFTPDNAEQAAYQYEEWEGVDEAPWTDLGRGRARH